MARTWEKFLDDEGLITELTDKDRLVGLRLIGDDPSPSLNPGDNIGIPIKFLGLYKKVTVTAAQLRACGTTPVTLLSSPGANKFHSVSKIAVSKKAGAVAFDLGDYLSFGSVGGDAQFVINNIDFNISGSRNFDLVKQGQIQIPNVAYQLTLVGGAASDATVGDSDVDIYIYYSIENVKV